MRLPARSGDDPDPPQQVDPGYARSRDLVQLVQDAERLRRLVDAEEILGQESCRRLPIGERRPCDLSAENGTSALLDVRCASLTNVKPEERDDDVVRDAAVRMQFQKLRRSTARFLVGAQQVQVLNPRRFDIHPSRRLRETDEPFGLHVDRAPKCRNAGEAIDNGVVVRFRKRFRVAQLSREQPGSGIGCIEGGSLTKCQLKLSAGLESFARLPILLERTRQTERCVVGCRRAAGGFAGTTVKGSCAVEGFEGAIGISGAEEELCRGGRSHGGQCLERRFEVSGRYERAN